MTPLEAMERLAATWFPDAMTDPATAERWIDVFADDVVVIEPASLPHGGRHEGLDAFRSLQATMRELWDQRIEAADYWPCGEDRVTLRIVIHWTARSTGRSVVLPMIDLLRFRDGRVVEVEAFVHDTQALLATLEPSERGEA
ncbi:MAG TPA: nuclear transport factor 2 family protein [Acidimicrobiales bacterium]